MITIPASALPVETIRSTANRVARRFAVASRPLQANMVRVYVEAELMLTCDRAGANVAMFVSRRNHARRMLVERCGFSPAMIVRMRAAAGLA